MFVEILIVKVLADDKGGVSTKKRARSQLLPLHSPPSIPRSSFYSNRSLGVEAFKQMERVHEPQHRDADMLRGNRKLLSFTEPVLVVCSF